MSYQIQAVEIKTLNIPEDSVSDFVTEINCGMVCDHMGCRRIRNFDVKFSYDNSQEVIPYADLTEAQVIEWIVDKHGQDNIDAMYELLKAECEKIANEDSGESDGPQVKTAPWVNANGG